MLSHVVKVLSQKLLFGLVFVFPTLSFALEPMSNIPRLYLSGYTGTDLVGQGDLLIPLYLINDRTFIVYGQGRYSPANQESFKYCDEYKTWTKSAGLLYRQVVPSVDAVLGAYLFGDYLQAASGYKYWSIGPGLESLGTIWDFHLNGYIPMGNNSWKKEAWAQEFGNYNYIQFAGNNVYDHRLAYYEEIGVGGDFEIGRKLFKFSNTLVKGYVQGYYYNMEHNSDVIGGGLKTTIQPAQYLTFSANYTYDNYQHSVFMLGAQVKINELFSRASNKVDENNLSNRLLDQIDRNYSSIGSGAIVPATQDFSDLGQGLYNSSTVFIGGGGFLSDLPRQFVYSADNSSDNNSFGRRSLLSAKGTYDNPYGENDIKAQGIEGILNEVNARFPDQANIYFAPGVYQGNFMSLRNGMSIFGKDSSYKSPADDQKVLFVGAVELSGNNKLDSISIQNDNGTFIAGIKVDKAINVILNKIEVGTLSNVGNYANGISTNNSEVVITDSKVYGYQNSEAKVDGAMNASGIEMTEGGSLIILASDIRGIAFETGGAQNNTGNGYGVHADGKNENIRVENHSYILGQGQGGKDSSGNGHGVFIGKNSRNSDAGADGVIEGNKLVIISSTLVGEGINKDPKAKLAGNSSALLFGHSYQYGDKDYKNNGGMISPIYGNEVIIDSSTLMSSGNSSGGSSEALSGNSYAFLFGSGCVFLSSIPTKDGVLNIDSSIHDNHVVVTNSVLSAKGKSDNSGAGYSGGAYAFLFGIDSVYIKGTNAFTAAVDLSIRNNKIELSDSRLIAEGNAISYPAYGYSGDAAGMMVGYVDLYKNIGAKRVKVDSHIVGNEVNFKNNEVIVNSLGQIGTSGKVWGVIIGKDGTYDVSNINKLDIANSTIKVDANEKEAYGLWMNASGLLTIDSYTMDNIMRTDNAVVGKKIDSSAISKEWSKIKASVFTDR
jgi:hypothetical protein